MRAAAAAAVAGFAAWVAGAGCASSSGADVGLEGLALTAVGPSTIVPGTTLQLRGASFVEAAWGTTTLRLTGDGLDLSLPATFVDFGTLGVAIDEGTLAAVGSRDVRATARVEVVAASDGETYATAPLAVSLQFRERLTPSTTALDGSGVIFVNQRLVVEGSGFLLGGAEGQTVARVDGCFTRDGQSACVPIAPIEIPMTPEEPLSRTRAGFAFSPKIAGISPGAFAGQVTVINKQPASPPESAGPASVAYDVVSSQIFSIEPAAASLGQYVFVRGGGFVGGEGGALTELELVGTFARNGQAPAAVSLTLIPEFAEGALVRYVISTDDELGQALDLRTETGQFAGTARPVVSYGGQRVAGVATAVTLAIAPVKQVVYLQYQPSYVEGLRDFGLRAVDNRIRERILAVCRAAYAGINIEFRSEPPADFALFENVELVGVDPNGSGLFGYDNSPGKDNGNMRLYDRLGGVNAQTQQDGYPGYGGVFIRSLMGFSKHPGTFATSVPGADVLFDQTFDAFRADRGGEPIRAADLGAVPVLADAAACPAADRAGRVACAIYVMGNLVGGTLAHEIGHSLGLANPYADGFHNAGDAPSRLMDAGGDRPFAERAELAGQGPGVFCEEEYAYLRAILPTGSSEPQVVRPGC